MNNSIGHRIRMSAAALALWVAGAPAFAQVHPSLVVCAELQDVAQQATLRLCSTHSGCVLMLNTQKACQPARGFLDRLGRTLSGRQAIDGNDVFEAYAPAATGDAAFAERSRAVVEQLPPASARQFLRGTLSNGQVWMYEGSTANGARHGYGLIFNENGALFRGQFVNGVQNGPGEWTNAARREVGTFQSYALQGQGIRRESGGGRYEGGFDKDQYSGYGRMTWPSGDRYEGHFLAGRRNSLGSYSWPSGNRYQGNWENDLRAGTGVMHYADGGRFEGTWRAGERVNGRLTLPDGQTYAMVDGVRGTQPLAAGAATRPAGRANPLSVYTLCVTAAFAELSPAYPNPAEAVLRARHACESMRLALADDIRPKAEGATDQVLLQIDAQILRTLRAALQ